MQKWGPSTNDKFFDLYKAEEKSKKKFYGDAYSDMTYYLSNDGPEILKSVKRREERIKRLQDNVENERLRKESHLDALDRQEKNR